MRKKFLSIITLLLALVIGVSSLSACKLITVDNKRDMEQIVATVQINENAPLEEIQKKDMISEYLNYGYMYEQYYGYTRAQVFNLIIKSIIENRVYVQNAMQEFDKQEGIFNIALNTDKAKWDIDRYLTEKEIIDAEYSAKKTISDFITSYEIAKDEEKQDTLVETVRTTPTDATNAEKEEPSKDVKKEYKIDVDSTSDRRKAYNKVIRLLEENELLGDDYKGDVTQTTYYNKVVKNNKEATLLDKYEDCIKKDILSKITYTDIQTAYENKYETQSNWTNAEFASALSSATTSDPILVSNGKGYGYVYNLLLGASEEQTAAISAIDANLSIKEKAEKRKEILDGTKVKDLRSTWILSGYDFDGEKFTGDYTFTKPENSLPFLGSVELLKAATEDASAQYSVKSVTEYSLSDFIKIMETYVYGAEQIGQNDPTNPSVYRKLNTSVEVTEYNEKINELLFAFSTDPGSLNTYKGYAIKPIPDGANTEEYMQEFADAGRELLKMGKTSYIIVATDYGYHVMFYSQMFDNYNYDTLAKYLETFGIADGKQEFNNIISNYEDYENQDGYLYLLTSSIVSSQLSNKVASEQREIINKYIYNEETSGVVKYESRYEDLLA